MSEQLEDRALLAGDLGLPAASGFGAEGEGEIVRFRVETADLFGAPVASVNVGEEFFVRVYAQDLRASAQGVASAFADLTYDDSLVSLDGALSAGAEYSTNFSGDTSVSGLIDEAGGISVNGPLGGDEQLVFSARFTAEAAGEVQFATDDAELSPFHDILLFGQSLAAAEAEIEYGSASLTITSGGLPFWEDFDDGAAADFVVLSGNFNLSGDAYVSAPTVGAEAVSAIDLDVALPDEFVIEATANASAATGGFSSNAFIVFDVQSATEFKYAGARADDDQWVIGQHTSASGFVDLAVVNESISADQDLNLQVQINGSEATLLVDGSAKVSHTFGDSLADGQAGVAVDSSITTFDNVSIMAAADAAAPPIAHDDTVSTTVDVAVDIDVTANDADVSGDVFSVISVTQGANGSVAINADNTLTYTPNLSFTGTDSFTYTIADNDGSATATVDVKVLAENTPPLASVDVVTTDEDVAVTVDVLANDSDADGDALVITSFTQGANGSVSLDASGSLVYQPNLDFSGTDSFTYSISDGLGGFASAVVGVSVSAVVDLPFAVNDAVSVSQNTSVDIDVLANDIGASLAVAAVTQGGNGSVAINANGTVAYTPNAGFVGVDTFTYTAVNGDGETDEGLVAVAVESSGSVLAAFRLEATDLLGNPIASVEAGQEFLLKAYVQDTSATAQGVVAAYLDVAFDSALATVSGPITFGAEFTSDQSGDVSVDGLINEVGGSAAAGATGSAELLLFSVPMSANADGELTFTSNIADVSPDHDVLLAGRTTAVASGEIEFGETSLTIDAVADLPFFEDFNAGAAADFDVLVGNFNVIGNAFVSAPALGGEAVAVVDLDASLPDDFMIQATVTALAGFGGFSSNAFIVFDVQSATEFKYAGARADDDQWVIGQHTAASGFVDLAVVSEPISANQNLDLKVQIEGGDATLLVDGAVEVSHSFGESLADGQVGLAVDSAISIFDNVSIMAGVSAELPPIAVNDNVTTTVDAAVNIDVTANDSETDGDAFTVVSVTQGANGSVVINADDTLTYTPNVSFTGTDTFTYTIADNDGTATATVSVVVTPDSVDLPFFEDFNDGTAADFNVRVGNFDLTGGAFVSAPAPGGNAAATVDLDVALPEDFMIQATVNAQPGSASGFWSNAFIIFDVQSATNFKYAGAFVGRGQWVIGQHTSASGFVDLAVASEPIPTNTDLDLKVNVEGDDVTLLVNGSAKVSHSFNGQVLADGEVGVAVRNAITRFDDVSIMASAEVELPPIARDDSVSTSVDAAVNIDVTANDSDPNGDSFTVVSVTQGANGSVAINANGTLTYTPNVSFTGTDTFTYTIADNDGSATANVTVFVGAGGLPFFEDFDDGTAADFTVRVGDFDLTGGAFVSAPAPGGNAAATIDLGVELPEDFMIQATVNAQSGSASGFWSNAFIIFDVQSATNFKYAGAFLGRGQWVIGQHTSASGFVDLAAASEPIPANTDLDLKVNVEGDDVTLLVNGAAKVSHSFNGQVLADGEVGVAVRNAITTFDNVSVMASVEAGLAPTAESDIVGTTVDTAVDIDVTANDSDPDGDPFAVISVTQGASGSVAINVDNTLTYTPDAGFIGVDTFSYTIADIDGSASADVVVIVRPSGGGLPFFEDFDDGAAADFTVHAGAFNISGDAFVSAPSVGGNAVATINVGASLPEEFMVEATVNANPSAGGFWSNAFIIFDVQSATNFKYAGAFVGRGQWVIGQHTAASGFVDLAVFSEPIAAGADMDLKLNVDEEDVTLLVNGSAKVSHSFDDQELADGEVGVATQNAITSFDNVRITATDEFFAELGG